MTSENEFNNQKAPEKFDEILILDSSGLDSHDPLQDLQNRFEQPLRSIYLGRLVSFDDKTVQSLINCIKRSPMLETLTVQSPLSPKAKTEIISQCQTHLHLTSVEGFDKTKLLSKRLEDNKLLNQLTGLVTFAKEQPPYTDSAIQIRKEQYIKISTQLSTSTVNKKRIAEIKAEFDAALKVASDKIEHSVSPPSPVLTPMYDRVGATQFGSIKLPDNAITHTQTDRHSPLKRDPF